MAKSTRSVQRADDKLNLRGVVPPGAAKMAATDHASMFSEMAADAPAPSEDKLDQIRKMMRELRDDAARIENLEQTVAGLKERRRQILEKDLVDLMDSAGVRDMTLDAELNYAAFSVEVGAYYHANIASDWPEEKRKKSFDWIDKYHPGMLKNTITISCAKNTRDAQKKLLALAAKLKMPARNEFGVPWNTLTSFVKEQIEEEKKTPPLELLGATVGRVAKIKKPKEK